MQHDRCRAAFFFLFFTLYFFVVYGVGKCLFCHNPTVAVKREDHFSDRSSEPPSEPLSQRLASQPNYLKSPSPPPTLPILIHATFSSSSLLSFPPPLMASFSSTTVVSLVALLFAFAEAKDHLVGGKDGAWKVPSSEADSLNKWAESTRFRIGDNLGEFFRSITVFFSISISSSFFL